MLAVTPSRTAGYLDAIENLTPLIEEHRASFDRDRRLPDVVFRALAEAGLPMASVGDGRPRIVARRVHASGRSGIGHGWFNRLDRGEWGWHEPGRWLSAGVNCT
jgi:hypothetical protein